MEINKEKTIEIFSGTLWESEMIVSLLKEANINSFIKNSVLNSYAYDPIYSSGVKVMVLETDFSSASEIVDEYYKNMKNKESEI
ncbi:MAG: DUF2007-related protein [Bacteroidia bacterium]|nr:DUF2007-related protein [Bacteroidia bacterium]